MSGGGGGNCGQHHVVAARANPGYYAMAKSGIDDEMSERGLAPEGEAAIFSKS
jgi:hypothetical protein